MAHILVVDDEPDLRNFIAAELRDAGYHVDTASNGVEAILQAIEGGLDAVVMDVRMPHLDGLDALRILRRLAPALPVVMCTGGTGRGDMLESNRLGAITCLAKPVVIERLREVLQQALGHG